jgi:hypothetical protein
MPELSVTVSVHVSVNCSATFNVQQAIGICRRPTSFNFVMTVAVSLHYLLNALWECGAPK